jgi:hypothetical protein
MRDLLILTKLIIITNFFILEFIPCLANIFLKCMKYIIILFYNTKISDNNAESEKVPRMLAAFPR